jgi:hypothetical protein
VPDKATAIVTTNGPRNDDRLGALEHVSDDGRGVASVSRIDAQREARVSEANERLLRGIPVIGGGHGHIAGTRPDQIAD